MACRFQFGSLFHHCCLSDDLTPNTHCQRTVGGEKDDTAGTSQAECVVASRRMVHWTACDALCRRTQASRCGCREGERRSADRPVAAFQCGLLFTGRLQSSPSTHRVGCRPVLQKNAERTILADLSFIARVAQCTGYDRTVSSMYSTVSQERLETVSI